MANEKILVPVKTKKGGVERVEYVEQDVTTDEEVRTSPELLDLGDLLQFDGQPRRLAEVLHVLRKSVAAIEARLAADYMKRDEAGDSAALATDYLAYNKDHESYVPEDFNLWACAGKAINTKDAALDCLVRHKVEKSALIETDDATDLASALTLVNELKAKLNDMNA
jgi:hypothetical protein